MARAKNLARRLRRLERRRKETGTATPIREVVVNEIDSAGNFVREIERVKNLWWIEPQKESDK